MCKLVVVQHLVHACGQTNHIKFLIIIFLISVACVHILKWTQSSRCWCGAFRKIKMVSPWNASAHIINCTWNSIWADETQSAIKYGRMAISIRPCACVCVRRGCDSVARRTGSARQHRANQSPETIFIYVFRYFIEYNFRRDGAWGLAVAHSFLSLHCTTHFHFYCHFIH